MSVDFPAIAYLPMRQIPRVSDVYLDGKIVPGCVLADEENGIVYCLVESRPAIEGNHRVFHPGGFATDEFGNLRIEQRAGVVRIVRDAREETKIDLIFGDTKGYLDAA